MEGGPILDGQEQTCFELAIQTLLYALWCGSHVGSQTVHMAYDILVRVKGSHTVF